MEPARTNAPEIIAAIRGGDREVFGRLVAEHGRSVFFVALRASRGDEQLARDVVQKTFLQAWIHRESFRGEASLKTWLLRIATNLCSNELRRAHRRREVVPCDPNGEPRELGTSEAIGFDRLEATRARELLASAIVALPPRQREVALLRIYQGLSFKEVAEVCGITANNAKVSFHNAVRAIRRRLAESGVEA